MNTELQTQQDLITPRKIEVWRIRFEAFGQEHTAYADIINHVKQLEYLVGQIVSTARVIEVCTDLVDPVEFERLKIINVEAWVSRITEYDHE